MPNGIKPWKKKIEAILKMKRSSNVKELLSFLGAVTYHRNMWPRRSHLLAPISDLTGKANFIWTDQCEHAFNTMKSLLSTDVLLVYPNHNLPFEVYSDASAYQMRAAIVQNGRPIAYWSRKFNSTQKNYTTMVKELLQSNANGSGYHSIYRSQTLNCSNSESTRQRHNLFLNISTV